MKPAGLVPVMEVGTGTEMLVFAGVHIEPHPKSYEDSEAWLEVNRWSCEPSMSCIAGFEYPSFVCKSPIVSRFQGDSRNPMYMVPVPCMLPASDLGIALAVRVRCMVRDGSIPDGLVCLDDWIGSDDFRRRSSCTPPLPCRECLRLNTQADGYPLRPKSRRPESMKSAPPDVRAEWEEYDRRIDRIFDIVDKASCYAEGRIVGHSEAKRRRRLRRTYYNKSVRLLESIRSLERRAARYDRSGNIDKAIEHRDRARRLRKELEDMRNGVHDKTT
jgi:hypothetical protein